jgi:phosphoglucosamine mutase
MVTASHNPAEDNGLKVVFGDGKKLSTGILAGISKELERPQRLGGGWRETRENAEVSYVNTLLAALPPGRWLAGQRILFDSAMGAGAAAGRRVLEALGAEVEPFAGRAINDRCGAVHPQFAAIVVRERACAAGLVIDGDGDRVALINARGQVLDGDAILWLLREGPAMVGTVMSNLGLERALLGEGIRLERAAVGDANVAARMSEIGASLGGEPSGHILVRNGCPTSDGLHVGLLALARGLELDTSGYTPFPQAHASLRNAKRVEVNTDFVMLAGGRAVVRRSGTEAVVRVMIEHSDINLANSLRDRVVALLLENP